MESVININNGTFSWHHSSESKVDSDDVLSQNDDTEPQGTLKLNSMSMNIPQVMILQIILSKKKYYL